MLVGVRGFEPPAPASRKQCSPAVLHWRLPRPHRARNTRTGGSGIIARSAYVISSLASHTFSAMSRTSRSRNVGESLITRVPLFAHSTQLPSRDAMGRLDLVGWKIISIKSIVCGKLMMSRPIELVVLNCCVTDTNDAPCASKISTSRVMLTRTTPV